MSTREFECLSLKSNVHTSLRFRDVCV